jgi:hypothetical protein
MGFEVVEGLIPREMLYIDEVFFSGTAAEATPIHSIDRVPVGNGKSGFPGPAEARLTVESQKIKGIDGAMQLFRSVTKEKLWPEVETAMVAHTATGRQPWIGSHGIAEFFDTACKRRNPLLGLDVGRNVRRFYFLRYGYAEAIKFAGAGRNPITQ